MILISYFIKTALISALLYGYYWFLLRNRRFHRYNRIYLLMIPVISLLLPALNIPLPVWPSSAANPAVRLLQVGQGDWEEAVTIVPGRSFFYSLLSIRNISMLVYLLVAGLSCVAFIRSLLYIRRISRKYAFETINGIKLFQTDEQGAPFSFFNLVFWSRPLEMHSSKGQQILRHELFHVEQKHSLDIIFLETLAIICWFNPFFHLLKNETRAIHEFLADQYAASGNNRYAYAELLLLQSMKAEQASIVHPFFHNQIKRRITMITKIQDLRNSFISRLMILPLLILLFCAFATRIQAPGHSSTFKEITVIIDAGHGGTDAGVTGNSGIREKDITLSIAQKIRELAKEYHVKVFMTREKDELPGNPASLMESLKYRAGLASQKDAELFVSIHANGNPKDQTASGFEIYVPDQSSPFFTKSRELGSTLSASIKKDYNIADELKERSQGIRIFKESTVPAVLIECGYLTNQLDETFISNEKNQEKIARDILSGILRFQQNQLAGTHGTAMVAAPVKSIDAGVNVDGNEPDTLPSTKPIYTKVEIESDYPGGSTAWVEYLKKNIKYPKEAVDNEIQGEVVVQFIVNKDGSLHDIKAISGPDRLTAESIRIVKESGKWNPAKDHGVVVDSYKRQPIIYKLQPAS